MEPDAVHEGPLPPPPLLNDAVTPPEYPLARLPLPPKAPSADTVGRASLTGSGLLYSNRDDMDGCVIELWSPK
jgi:hypothetical protein